MKGISVASSEQADKITDLRRAEYAREFENFVSDRIGWGADDESAVVLIAFDMANILSTMRSQVVWTRHAAEAATETSFDAFHLKWPALILERAATASEYRSRGL